MAITESALGRGCVAEEMTLAEAIRKPLQRVERTDVRLITKLSFNVYF